MNLSLKSRHKRIVAALLVILVILYLYLFQRGFSQYLYQSKAKITDYLSSSLGYRVILNKISFSIFKGFRVKEILIFYDDKETPPIFIKDAHITIKTLPLFLGQIIVDEVKIHKALFLVVKKKDGYNLQIMLSSIFKKIADKDIKTPTIFTNRVKVFIGSAKIIYIGNAYLEKNMYVLLKNARIEQKFNKFKFNSDIEFSHNLSGESYFSRFFKNRMIHQAMKCTVQGDIKGENLDMGLIVLKIGDEQILGMGVNKGFAEKNPYLNIIFIPSTISLDNINFLKENFNARGNIFISLKLNGPMDNIKPAVSGLLDDCNFRYDLTNNEAVNIKNLNGNIECGFDFFKFENGNLIINGIPLNIKIQTSKTYEPNISLNLSVSPEFFSAQNISLGKFEIIFNGKIKNALLGNLEFNVLYVRKGRNLDMRAYCKNLEFDYKNLKEKNLRIESIELIKNNRTKIQKLNLSNLKAKVYLRKKLIELKELQFNGYNGIFVGEINLDMADKVTMTVALKAQALDVKTLMQDVNISDKLSSGTMNLKIMFNNRLTEFLKGRCFIKEGAVNLDAFAAIVKLPPLTQTRFNIMHAYFSISRNMIKVRAVKLDSPDIRFNAYWDMNGKIYGILNLRVASGLLNQSLPFKKLLRLTRIQKPYIDFAFLLGGVPEAVRVMWLKGEFKERIAQDLPAWVSKRIEDNLGKTIDELSKDKNNE